MNVSARWHSEGRSGQLAFAYKVFSCSHRIARVTLLCLRLLNSNSI